VDVGEEEVHRIKLIMDFANQRYLGLFWDSQWLALDEWDGYPQHRGTGAMMTTASPPRWHPQNTLRLAFLLDNRGGDTGGSGPVEMWIDNLIVSELGSAMSGEQPPRASGNQPPVARADGDQELNDSDGSGDERTTLDATASSDADGTITIYKWMEGAVSLGTTAITSVDLALGAHTITCTVTDDDGATATDTIIVTVHANQPPHADAGSPQTALAGTKVSFNGAASSDPDGEITAYFWDLGDGTHSTGTVVTHSYPVPGDYIVTLTVTDTGNATNVDTTDVHILTESSSLVDTMHVHDITLHSRRVRFRSRLWTRGYATITIVDAENQPIEGAIVTGHWSGFTDTTSTGVTNTDGQVILRSEYVSQAINPITFTVDQVDKAGWVYDATANTETTDSIQVHTRYRRARY
jgi:PKD repeat protein